MKRANLAPVSAIAVKRVNPLVVVLACGGSQICPKCQIPRSCDQWNNKEVNDLYFARVPECLICQVKMEHETRLLSNRTIEDWPVAKWYRDKLRASDEGRATAQRVINSETDERCYEGRCITTAEKKTDENRVP